MYSAYRLNQQGDTIQPWWTSFPILNQSVRPCLVLIVASWLAYRFLRRQVRWSGIPISLRIFQFVVIHTVRGFDIVNEAEVDVFLEFSCFVYGPMDGCTLISGSSAFLSPACVSGGSQSLYCWSMENFEHYFASFLIECNCVVVWTFFGFAFLWDWNENWPYSVRRPLLSFSSLQVYWVLILLLCRVHHEKW